MIGNEIVLTREQHCHISLRVTLTLFSNLIYLRLYGTLNLNFWADGTYSTYSLMTSKKEVMLDFRILNT